ncbi:hypothetical protein JCM2811A_04270 [Methylorubrum rhodinum]
MAAATICIALVIFCVAFTEVMRLRRSFKLAIEGRPGPFQRASPPPCGEEPEVGVFQVAPRSFIRDHPHPYPSPPRSGLPDLGKR